jgi:hypothetical protein
MQFPTQLTLMLALALWACLPAARPAQADELIYKSVEPNGETSYSWRPDPDAVRTEPIEIKTLTPEQRRAMERSRSEDLKAERSADAYAARLQEQWTRVDNEIRDATEKLQAAEAKLRSGRTPLPGEREGMRGGGSRLTQAYFDRLRGLALKVERAKQRLDQSYAARNALK